MTNRLENPVPTSRRLACAGCGTEFGCNLSGPCWCMEEQFRMPMPSDGGVRAARGLQPVEQVGLEPSLERL